MGETLFIVTITDENGDDQYIHSVWQKEEDAENEVSRLQSSMVDSLVSYEEHEVN